MVEVDSFIARTESVTCPNCGAELYDLIGDPRGKEFECDECGEKFKVSANAVPEIE